MRIWAKNTLQGSHLHTLNLGLYGLILYVIDPGNRRLLRPWEVKLTCQQVERTWSQDMIPKWRGFRRTISQSSGEQPDPFPQPPNILWRRFSLHFLNLCLDRWLWPNCGGRSRKCYQTSSIWCRFCLHFSIYAWIVGCGQIAVAASKRDSQ